MRVESSPQVRAATAPDFAPITQIYNHYIRETPTTFDVEPYSVETRRLWFDAFDTSGPHRLFVAELSQQIVGYASSTRFRPKAAYDTTVETTVYLAPGYEGRGIGSSLYAGLFAALVDCDLNRAVAGITLPNPGSTGLHRKFGFEPIGTFHQVGRKFDRYWDVAWLEKPLP